MELEKQVCSRALARKLHQLGAKQSSQFVWWYTEAMVTDTKYFPEVDWEKREWTLRPRTKAMQGSHRDVAAFTVAELGEMLPAGYKTTHGHDLFIIEGMPDEPFSIQRDPTEADARAKMLVYLLENKLVGR